MMNGPYSVVHCTPDEESDGLDMKTLGWGYDSGKRAYADMEKLAEEAGVDVGECAVVRMWTFGDLAVMDEESPA